MLYSETNMRLNNLICQAASKFGINHSRIMPRWLYSVYTKGAEGRCSTIVRHVKGPLGVILLMGLSIVIGFHLGCWFTEEQRHWTETITGSHFESPFQSKPSFPARKNSQSARIMCMILTSPATHRSRAIHALATWGRHCDGLIFLTSEEDVLLPTLLAKDSADKYSALWPKLREGLVHLYEAYVDDYDYFLKADDDTYVVIENLRTWLESNAPSVTTGLYAGSLMRPLLKDRDTLDVEYIGGGPGYVMDRTALRKFVEVALRKPECFENTKTLAEDMQLGLCFQSIGIRPVNFVDNDGRVHILPLSLQDLYLPRMRRQHSRWMSEQLKNPIPGTVDCCASNMISFHYVHPSDMYLMEFLIYHFNLTERPE